MKRGHVEIADDFAEAFRMRFTRLVITAASSEWARIAAREVTGYGSSVIACDAEAGVERELAADETPDARPGVSVLFFGFSTDSLATAVQTRIGQCVLTCPTTAVYSGMHGGSDGGAGNGAHDSAEEFGLGKLLRYFGDGWQKSKVLDGRRFWRIPVMDGEFIIEETALSAKGIAGGNLLVQGRTQLATLEATRDAVSAIDALPDVITPFPGGIARSGSKVGSKYRALRASTNDAFCPTLSGRVETRVHPGANAVYEIIINGVDEPAVSGAMRAGIDAICADGRHPDVIAISAGNYGGKLGKFHFHLREVLAGS